jgi:UDP:flavonoid glycosyltransferase YjiC (YdhE family)
MARIVLAWELGGGYGHLVRLGALARALRALGHDPVLVLKDLSYVAERLGKDGFTCLQAPLWIHPRAATSAEISFIEILLGTGFDDPVRLSGLVGAWRTLFDLVEADLVVSDMAPAACMAADIDGLPVVLIGNGFFPPRLGTPMPGLLPGAGAATAALHAVDTRFLATVNLLREAAGLDPLGRARAFFERPAIHCTLPESDPGGPRAEADYTGPLLEVDAGAEPAWPHADGPRLFGYLSGRYGAFDALIAALHTVDASILLHVRDLDPARTAGIRRPNLELSLAPVRMSAALAQADAVLCHATHGTVDAALLAGRPLICAPGQIENALIAAELERRGLSRTILQRHDVETMRAAIAAVLADTGVAARAAQVSARGDWAAGAAQRAAARCAALLPGPD